MTESSAKRLRIAMIGCGAIGRTVLDILRHDPSFEFDTIIVTARGASSAEAFARSMGVAAEIGTELPETGFDVLVETAGHGAVAQHVVPALRRGIYSIVTSVGSLSVPGFANELEAAARTGGAQVEMISGAIGALDALAAAREGGLRFVRYSGRKPPRSWLDTRAVAARDLSALTSETVIFSGNARDAALLFPKNANVAAAVAFAGLGLDETQVRLIADPAVEQNVHALEVEGAFGSFELTMRNMPAPGNPKTSLLAAYSVIRALRRRTDRLVV